ncbi:MULTISPECIES: hypothetical protein [unclassified Gordonia (in: high G+C Gram-positive bacteria)]|uniref:hypothetical protein n=1 Tax=unclassified Gordonia (in: high G+C Gram-positive bacteria) TaxID=2657482 RepID=UPI0009ABDCB9|nr:MULTISPECIES: hypothetical protein [unclassified Gordonia (in: high G+C Gram-positive bacteria)]MDF3281092.1 hypothetical protein [Gordonia sp. N1V]OPX14999.1 hypothetical protein B1964_12315 [Gordonia sp. i37]
MTASAARHAVDEDNSPRSSRTFWLRAIGLLILLVVVIFYLTPRIYNLVATPYRLDAAVGSASKYNPALDRIVGHEEVTLTAFNALDSLDASLASVLKTDAAVADQLKTLVGQIRTDMVPILSTANANVGDLVGSLNTLTSRIKALQPPVDGATAAVAADRATLQGILDDAASTAAKVHQARLSAANGAGDLSGR